MKVALVSPWSVSANAVGGTERFIVDLAESLVRLGHSVDVLMFFGVNHSDNGANYISLNLLGDDVAIDEYKLRQELGDFSKASTYSSLAQKIESTVDVSQYDIVQINTQLLLRAWTGSRRIFTIHTNPFEYKQAWGDDSFDRMIQVARAEASNAATVFTAPSRHYADIFTSAMGTNVNFIPHAIDVSRVVSPKSKYALTQKYGLDATKLHVLMPSRLEPTQKQPGLLFDCLQYLSPELLSRIEILSSGVDAQYRAYQSVFTAQANNLGCSVFFGRFDEMSDAYRLADVVVLPSQSESFGYAALESLSLGLPTILNDIPTFREIADGHPAAKFFGNDSRELADILQLLLTDGTAHIKADNVWYGRYDIASWGKLYEDLM